MVNKTNNMEHENLIRKLFGINTPDWIVSNIQKLIDDTSSKQADTNKLNFKEIVETKPLLLEKIILEYKDDLDSPNWKVDVYANGKNIGYLRRGDRFGFWFESKLGKAILKESRDELKLAIYQELERYRIFFKQ
jgi:hypothetical protein